MVISGTELPAGIPANIRWKPWTRASPPGVRQHRVRLRKSSNRFPTRPFFTSSVTMPLPAVACRRSWRAPSGQCWRRM